FGTTNVWWIGSFWKPATSGKRSPGNPHGSLHPTEELTHPHVSRSRRLTAAAKIPGSVWTSSSPPGVTVRFVSGPESLILLPLTSTVLGPAGNVFCTRGRRETFIAPMGSLAGLPELPPGT